jgi:hypothetical protein
MFPDDDHAFSFIGEVDWIRTGDDFSVIEAALCDDSLDNDGDGLTDYPDDPGCAAADDDSEKDETGAHLCDDGDDNDDDTLIDYPDDPGCYSPAGRIENPQCQDGVNNDFSTGIDFDGGESLLG